MVLGRIWSRIKSNHFAVMAICCILPILFIVFLKLVGFDAPWVYLAAIGICIGSHIAMTVLGSKGEKTCH